MRSILLALLFVSNGIWAMPLAWAAEPRPTTVVAFGDSTTALRGSIEVYAERLARRFPAIEFVNSGVPGNTTDAAMARFQRDVLDHAPNAVIIQFGINDSAVDVWKRPPAKSPRVPLEKYRKNLSDMVSQLKSRGVPVIFMTPNPLRWSDKVKALYGKPPYQPDREDGFDLPLQPYVAAAREIAKEQGVELIDIHAAFLESGKTLPHGASDLLLDGMHPNDAGQRIVAERLAVILQGWIDANKLVVHPRAAWKPSGPDVLISPACTDVTHDAPHEAVLGCGLAKLKSGGVATAYSAPSSYSSPPGSTFIAIRSTLDGGRTWSAEREIARHADCQASHPSLLVDSDGVIHVFYLGFKKHLWKDGNPTAEDQSDVWTVHSRDEGRTWSRPLKVFQGYSGATNGAIQTRDGAILVSFSHYVSNPGRLNGRTATSRDGGQSWTLGSPIDIGGAGDHEGAVEPALLELRDGRVWMLIRTSRAQFWESYSPDQGRTWSPAEPTKIASTHAPGHVARLHDGRIALAWNQPTEGRSRLWLALSADEGKTWEPPLLLAKGRQVTYPFVMEMSPGEIWVGYHDVHLGWGKGPRARAVKLATPGK